MDARSIAATAKNGGRLTAATELDVKYNDYEYKYDDTPYKNRVYRGYGKAKPEAELKYGPGIADWPKIPPLHDDVLLEVAAYITDPVTTTDELIPSGETSSYRSNPYQLSEFPLSRKVPEYVGLAKRVRDIEAKRESGEDVFDNEYKFVSDALGFKPDMSKTQIGSIVCSLCPGDGSAREQAASCQRVLGGLANVCADYATKRYRSNLINWGMLPFRYGTDRIPELKSGDVIYVKGVADAIKNKKSDINGIIIYKDGRVEELPLILPPLTDEEREIILCGCLINSCGKK
jgi:aconitate hydratase